MRTTPSETSAEGASPPAAPPAGWAPAPRGLRRAPASIAAAASAENGRALMVLDKPRRSREGKIAQGRIAVLATDAFFARHLNAIRLGAVWCRRFKSKPAQAWRDAKPRGDRSRRAAGCTLAPRRCAAARRDRARVFRGPARHGGQYRLPRHHPQLRPRPADDPVGGDLLRPDQCRADA